MIKAWLNNCADLFTEFKITVDSDAEVGGGGADIILKVSQVHKGISGSKYHYFCFSLIETEKILCQPKLDVTETVRQSNKA